MPQDNLELEQTIENTAGIKPDQAATTEYTPIYKVVGDSKIPVSRHLGSLWKSRIDGVAASRKVVEDCWSEAIMYYDNDQLAHRAGGLMDRAGNSGNRRHLTDRWSETENVVFSNTTTSLPMLYAKNPSVEITPINEAVTGEFVKCCEKLVNTLLNMKTAPGLNAKSKARRAILWALLTNNAYSKVDFVLKDDSVEAAIESLNKISTEYAAAKTQAEIKELEGQLVALEEKISIVDPSGPKFKLVNPFRLYIDSNCLEPDHSDAMWMAEYDFLPTAYINAVYAQNKDNQIVSIYEPTHILKGNATSEGINDEINNFSLFSSEKKSYRDYGYNDKESYDKACYTKVWWIWDKTTRRLLLYADNKWAWPLWVWDDPLKLAEFFPYDHLWFHETPEGAQPKGEVTYYLDQQDAINDINSMMSTARRWASLKLFYDKNKVKQDDVDKLLTSDQSQAVGIDVPEGMKLNDMVETLVPPALRFTELFNAESKFASINRITGISDAQRGAQFKTNTTNDAINFYEKNIDIRIDEKIDAIEDWIGMIAWKILQLCAQHWRVEDVAAIIGKDAAAPWQQIQNPNDLRTKLLVRVVGGSTDKPTSKNKKKAALEVGQVLGQFANAIPAVGVVLLKVFSRAFADDIVITNEDWKMIYQTMLDQQKKAGGGPGNDPDAANEDAEVAPEHEQQLKDIIASLPPEKKQEMQKLIQQGVSPSEALQRVTQAQTNQ